MKVKKTPEKTFLIELSGEELRILKDCILNLDNDMSDADIGTRVGATRKEIEGLLEDLLSGLRV